MGNKGTTPLRPDSFLGEFTKVGENRISENTARGTVVQQYPWWPGWFYQYASRPFRYYKHVVAVVITFPVSGATHHTDTATASL